MTDWRSEWFENDDSVYLNVAGQGPLPRVSIRAAQEATIGPLTKLIASLANDPSKLAQVRAEFDAMAVDIFEDNTVRMPFLMARATKV